MALPIAAISGGVQLLGGLFSGRSQAKAAKQNFILANQVAEQAMVNAQTEKLELQRLRNADQSEYQRLRRLDQADLERLTREYNAKQGASGVDLVKLRDEAVKAGFNPLTVLNATGGAGYGRGEGIISSPFSGRTSNFFSRQDAFQSTTDDAWQRVATVQGSGQALIDTAGYVGRAISAGGSAFVSAAFNEQQLANDRMIAQAAVNNSGSQIRAQAGQQGGQFPQQGATVSTSPQSGASWLEKLTGSAEKFLDRAIDRNPVQDEPAFSRVDDGRGNWVWTPSAAVYDDGPMAWIREWVSPAQLGAMQWGDQFATWGRQLKAMNPKGDGKTPDQTYLPYVWPADPAF